MLRIGNLLQLRIFSIEKLPLNLDIQFTDFALHSPKLHEF